jgi:hypothetical protein
MTLEMGKSISESRTEITYAEAFFRWFAKHAVRIEIEVLRERVEMRESYSRLLPRFVARSLERHDASLDRIELLARKAMSSGAGEA